MSIPVALGANIGGEPINMSDLSIQMVVVLIIACFLCCIVGISYSEFVSVNGFDMLLPFIFNK